MTKVLVIAPHFDDCELGVGGFLTRLKAKDNDMSRVVLAVTCNGAYKVLHSQELLSPEVRLSEAETACKLIGVDKLIPLNLGFDNSLLQADFGMMVPAIDKLIDREKPDILFIPMPSCNPDHEAVYRVCMASLRPQRALTCKVYAYEYPLSNWGAGSPQHEVMGRTYTRLTQDELQHKVDAVMAYATQVQGREQTLAGEAGVRALARMRGLECGSEHSEMFYLVRDVL